MDIIGIAIIWCLGVWTGWLIRDLFVGGTLTIYYRGRVIYRREADKHEI